MLNPFSLNTGHEARRRRVAAYCNEIATQAVLQPRPEPVPERLLQDLRLRVEQSQRHDVPDGRTATISSVIEMAGYFDDTLEEHPYCGLSLTTQLEKSHDPAVAFFLPKLRECTVADVLALIPQLSVFPAVAAKALHQIQAHDVTVSTIVDIARTDQVLAGHLLSAANSALHGLQEPIRELTNAVVYIGVTIARRTLVAAIMKPLLVDVSDLWSHSIAAAEVAAAIAAVSPNLDPEHAYVVGLLHDVGRLLLRRLPPRALTKSHRLVQNGCAMHVAEAVTFGMTHAEAGGHVLRRWSLPREYITAVEHHHEPELCDSVLAALLYLTEFWTESNEDLPSTFRLNGALQRVGITYNQLMRVRVRTAIAGVASLMGERQS
jgi:putative nucleotidyltransferase with HDIG domain